MSTYDFELVNPPANERRRELWLQHAAGFILFEYVRKRALSEIAESASAEARSAAEKAIDDCMYALMRLIDGNSGALMNADFEVDLRMIVRLASAQAPDAPIQQLDLRDGDGFCMGFHYWKEGDFGDDPVAAPRQTSAE
ncbi:MAG: hypothetical protein R3C31_00945 [Hyphomonadaceae bacterium]